MIQRKYSRLNSIEHKKNIRSAAMYMALTIAAILLMFFLGIPLLGRTIGFLADLQTSDQQIDSQDTTPPAPPSIDLLPEVTNKTAVEITGRTEEGAIVVLTFNDSTEEIVANSEGAFSYNWNLWKGENTLKALARDKSGNESQETKTFTLSYDDTPPDLTIDSPSNGHVFNGTRERQISIEGSTESGTSLNINGRRVVVDDLGDFSFFTSLSEGENVFDVVAKDDAGNETKTSFSVTFNP